MKRRSQPETAAASDHPEPQGWMRTESIRLSNETSCLVLESAQATVRRAQNQVRRSDAILKRLRRYLPAYAITLTEGAPVPDCGAGSAVPSSSGLDDMYSHPGLPTANPGSILLIELDPDTAEMYDVGLSLEGFRPYVATDEEQTIELLRTHRPEAVVADLGSRAVVWKLVDAVRMEESTRALPVVLLTECVDPLTSRRAAELGCAALLLKPCVPDYLASVLRKVAAPSYPTRRV
jgi:two-component system, chemotaxis family, chemotaxis protein CheY